MLVESSVGTQPTELLGQRSNDAPLGASAPAVDAVAAQTGERDDAGAGAVAAEATPVAVFGTGAEDGSVVEATHDKDALVPLSTNVKYWCGSLHTAQFFKLCCLPRFIILAAVVRRLLRGPISLYFIFPLWALVYCVINIFFFIATSAYDPGNNNLEEEEEGPNTEAEAPFLSRWLQYLRTYSRFSVISLIVWNFIDTVLTIVILAISVGSALFLFTDVDGVVEGCWEAEYASAIASTIFCGIAVICDISSFFIGIRYYILSARLAVMPEPPSMACVRETELESGIPAPDQNDGTSTDKRVHLCCRIKDPWCFRYTLTAGVLGSVLIVSVIYLSMSLHDELRSRYYEGESTASYADCDPLVPKACMMPFPSSYWLKKDSSAPSGYRVRIGSSSLPYIKKGFHGNPDALNRQDGFSVSAPILWHLDSIVESQLVPPTDVNRSLMINSTTLLINAETSALHPHFSELDYLDTNTDRVAYSMPATALEFNNTYVVVVQGLADASGRPLRDSDLWSSYRSLYESKSYVLPTEDARFDHYVNFIFPALESLGLDLSKIHLAWDFRTSSSESMSRLLNRAVSIADEKMRSILLNGDLDYEIIRNDKRSCSGINASSSSAMASTMHIRVNVPWILEGYGRIGVSLNQKLMYSADNQLPLNEIPVGGRVGILVQMPCSVSVGLKNASSIIEFGHGLFGSRLIATDDWLRESSNRNGWILWSSDWRGITLMDSWGLGRLVGDDNSDFDPMEANLLQSFASKTAIRLLLPQLLSEISCKLQLCSAAVDFENLSATSAYLRTQVTSNHLSNVVSDDQFASLPTGYIGHSMGAIIGAAWSAVAGYSRSVGLAGGSPFTFILGRSDAFLLAKLALDFQYYSR